MNRLSESVEHYQQALKNGRKAQRQSKQKSKSTVLPVLDDLLKKGIVDGRIDPFYRHIVSQDGSLRNDGGAVFSPEEILHMDWLCNNVEGTIPDYDSLAGKARSLVRLQGIYRDRIPIEKESILL